MVKNAYDFYFNKIDGSGKINLSDYRGKVILIVNTASFCGFTKQYKELELLWQTYKSKEFILIAVPSNNFFGKQEFKTNEEIANFCAVNYSTSFLFSQLEDVIGDKSHPFFMWVREKLGWAAGPKWNFYKYLITTNGELVTWFSSITSPTSSKITKLIEENLSDAT